LAKTVIKGKGAKGYALALQKLSKYISK